MGTTAEEERGHAHTAETRPDGAEQQEPLAEDQAEEAQRPSAEDEVVAVSSGWPWWDPNAGPCPLRLLLRFTSTGRLFFELDTVMPPLQAHLDQLRDALLRQCSLEEQIMLIAPVYPHLEQDKFARAALALYHSLIYMEAAWSVADEVYKKRYWRRAADLAGAAGFLVPGSLAIANLFTTALKMAGVDPRLVASACESALAIENPHDMGWISRGEVADAVTMEERLRIFRRRIKKVLTEMIAAQSEKEAAGISSEVVPTLTFSVQTAKRRPLSDAQAEVQQSEYRRAVAITFWKENMTLQQRRWFFCIPIGDLESYCDEDALQDVRDALAFVRTHRLFKGWACSLCKEVLPLTEEFSSSAHMESRHIDFCFIHQTTISSLMPEEVELECVDVIKTDFEKGLDASIKIADALGDTNERNDKLKKIQFSLCFLIEKRCLYKSYFEKVLQFANHEFRTLVSELVRKPVLITKMPESSLQRLCFLRALQLDKILNFLGQLLRLFTRNKMDSSEVNDQKAVLPDICYDPDSTCLMLDERHFYSDADKDNCVEEPDADSLICWLYPNHNDNSFMAEVVAWARDRLSRTQTGVKVLGKLKDLQTCLNDMTKQRAACIKELQAEDKEASTGTTCEDSCWTLRDYKDKNENPTRKSTIVMQQLETDACIMKLCDKIQQAADRLAEGHTLDYRTMLVTLMRSFMQNGMDEMVKQDALYKSEAAIEGLLSLQSASADQNKVRLEKKKGKKKAKKAKKDKTEKDVINNGDLLRATPLELSPEPAETDNVSASVHSGNGLKEDDELDEMRLIERNLKDLLKIEDELKPSRLEGNGKIDND